MAIVRTTTRETGTKTGNTQPVDKNPASAGRGNLQRAPQRGTTTAPAAAPNEFFADVKTELSRVHWPTTEEVRSGVIVTIGLLVFCSLYIFGLDVIAEKLIGALVAAK